MYSSTDTRTEGDRDMTETGIRAAVQVGDFFVCSWGYDQTNVDYYKVISLTPKCVKVQEWSKQIVQGAGRTV